MIEKLRTTTSRIQAALIAICIMAATTGVRAQPEKSQVPTHKELYARAAAMPLAVKALRAVDGAKLTDAQTAELAKADAAFDKAESLFAEGKFAESAAEAVIAVRARATILGQQHYLTAKANALASVAVANSKMPEGEQKQFAEADAALREWETLNKQGRYEAARDSAVKALDYCKSNLPEAHPMTALAYLRLGTTQIDLGEFKAALENIEKSKSLTRIGFGESHPRYADVMDRLGWVNVYLAGQGVFSKEHAVSAVDALETAVQIYRTTIGETLQTAESLDNLGTAYAYVQRYNEALESKLRALFIRETLIGPDARDTGVSLSNLAWLYGRLGLTSEVLPLRERALAIFKKLLRPDHPYIYLESANVGWDYHLLGRDDEAIELFESLVEQDERRTEKARPDVVQRLSRLAELYAIAGRFDAARTAIDRAHNAAVAIHAAGYAEQAIASLSGVARSTLRSRMYGSADRLYAQVCAWAAAADSPVDDLERGVYEMSYGSVLLERGDAKGAKAILETSIKRIESASPKNPGQLIEPLIHLARAETELGEFKAATKHCDRAVQIAESRSQEPGFATAFPQLWLGRAYAKAGNFSLANFQMLEAKDAFDRLADRDPTGSIIVRIELGIAMHAASKQSDAVNELKDALSRCRKVESDRGNAHLDAMTARAQRTLYDITKSGGATSQERETWRKDAVAILKKLDSNQLLNAEEKAWLAANGA